MCAPPRKFFKRLFPFKSTQVAIATAEPALIEWLEEENREFLIHTQNIWNVVHLIRYMRMKGKYRSEVVRLHGLGDVLL